MAVITSCLCALQDGDGEISFDEFQVWWFRITGQSNAGDNSDDDSDDEGGGGGNS